MEQAGVHPLQPTGSFIDQVFVEADQYSGVEDLGWRDPRLGDPAVDQQLAQVASVSPVGLSPALPPSQSGCFRRFGHMSSHARPY